MEQTHYCDQCGKQINEDQKLLVEQAIKYRILERNENEVFWTCSKTCEEEHRSNLLKI
jgi:ribosomal protein L24E